MYINLKQKEALMCLESGTKVTIDGKSAIVVAASGNRICATMNDNDLTIVRDVKIDGEDMIFTLPEKLLS